MKLLWGDIHNHCGITYGYGSLKNALERAKSHLDFCAVTGHAMWPDIPDRTEETAFVVDFHQAGFEKLRAHWDEVAAQLAACNSKELVTFQGGCQSTFRRTEPLPALLHLLPVSYRCQRSGSRRKFRCGSCP